MTTERNGESNKFWQLAPLFTQSFTSEKLKFWYNQKKEEIATPNTDISA